MRTELIQTDNEIEKSGKNNQAQKDRVNDLSYPQWMPRGLFRAIGPIGLLVLVVGVAVGFYAYGHVTKDSVRFPFWVSFMFSFLAFVVLLVQSVIYAQQAEFMKQQSKAMQDSVDRTDTMIENMQGQLTSMVNQEAAMQGQLKAMNEQRELMNRSIENTRQDSIYAQRAYVTAKMNPVNKVLKRLDLFQFRLRIENSGNTPANNVSVSFTCELRENPPWDMNSEPFSTMPDKQIAFDTQFDRYERCGVIAPNGSHHTIKTPEIGFPAIGDFNAYEAERLKFYCWGTIVYEDIFNEKRHTDFCFYQSRGRPDGFSCEHGNEAY